MTLLPLEFDTDQTALEVLAGIPAEAVENGEVFTKAWIVAMILDLVGYSADSDLTASRLVEPACGHGAFLSLVASRVSQSCRRHGHAITDAVQAVRAFDLLETNVADSRRAVVKALRADGWDAEAAVAVAEAWVRQGDYLLQDHDADTDFVVGNPPYIRLEDVPNERTALYRRRWPTMTGRADIYVGFYEAGLRSLRPGGVLGFICADRWMRNQYGQQLRAFIGDRYSLEVTIGMHDVDAFEETVAAYPAVTVIRNREQRTAAVVETTKHFDADDATTVTDWIGSGGEAPARERGFEAARLQHWYQGTDFWPTGSPARIATLDDLAQRYPTLEDPRIGARVGIGVATGADKIFITNDRDLVESDRLLPLSMVRDVTSGHLDWTGHYLVNPWDERGKLVDLNWYPRLKNYFETHRPALAGRYIAKKQPERWYKTIDKVAHHLTERSKLLFPDMKLSSHPVLDRGGHYPHHNLYYVTAEGWDLEVLGGLLLSRVADAFVSAYAVRMRGKTLRFQAQYLRRIRIPERHLIAQPIQDRLAAAFRARDVDEATAAALDAYQLEILPD